MNNLFFVFVGATIATLLTLWRPATNPAFRAINMLLAWVALVLSLLAEFMLGLYGAWKPGAALFLTVFVTNLWCAASPASMPQLRWRVGAIALIITTLMVFIERFWL